MRITKLKLGTEVEVSYEEECAREGDSRVVQFRATDDVHPDLRDAARAVVLCVLSRLELAGLHESTRLSGVSVKHDERYELGYVATLLVERAAYNSPLVINSPFVRRSMAEEDPDNNPEAFIDADEHDALELLLREAVEYVSGRKRAQADLFSEQPSGGPATVDA